MGAALPRGRGFGDDLSGGGRSDLPRLKAPGALFPEGTRAAAPDRRARVVAARTASQLRERHSRVELRHPGLPKSRLGSTRREHVSVATRIPDGEAVLVAR